MNQIKETHDLALATWKCKNAVMYPKIGDAKTIREIHSFGHISSLPIPQNSPWLCQKCPLLFTFQIQTAAAAPDTFHKSALILFFPRVASRESERQTKRKHGRRRRRRRRRISSLPSFPSQRRETQNANHSLLRPNRPLSRRSVTCPIHS